jgi:hypothetical protein
MSGRRLIVLVVALCLAGRGVPNRDGEAVRGDRWTSCVEELARDRADKRADAMRLPLIALLAAPRLPDERRQSGISCGDVVVPVPWLALVGRDGRWLRPGVPRDVCRKPHPGHRGDPRTTGHAGAQPDPRRGRVSGQLRTHLDRP